MSMGSTSRGNNGNFNPSGGCLSVNRSFGGGGNGDVSMRTTSNNHTYDTYDTNFSTPTGENGDGFAF